MHSRKGCIETVGGKHVFFHFMQFLMPSFHTETEALAQHSTQKPKNDKRKHREQNVIIV